MHTFLILLCIFIVGCLIGRARRPSSFKILGILALTLVFGLYEYYRMGDALLGAPLSPATTDLFSRVLLFCALAFGGAAVTNAARLNIQKRGA
jgi:hypothetical protein